VIVKTNGLGVSGVAIHGSYEAYITVHPVNAPVFSSIVESNSPDRKDYSGVNVFVSPLVSVVQ